MDNKNYSIVSHLKDLRKCLFYSIFGVIFAAIGCFIFSDKILFLLRNPLQAYLGDNAKFIVLVPHEYFFAQMKVSFVLGIFVASPWIFYQIWLFVSPGLYKKERASLFCFVVVGVFFFVAGALFCYFLVFPSVFSFFAQTLPAGVEGAYSIGMILNFLLSMLLAFAVVFEAPVMVFLLIAMDLVEIESFSKYRRYVILAAFVIAAILTPTPDPLTQTLMAGPMIVLYELGLLAAKLSFRKRKVA